MNNNVKMMGPERIEDFMQTEYLNSNDPKTPNREFANYPQNQQDLVTETISSFFDNTIILVTGGTGFLGKALLEKLLRSCPKIDTIYILMRPKRGLTVEQRYKELLKNQVFDKIRAKWPERLSKLLAITGDVSAPGLGISGHEAALVKDVEIVFHSAATVRFTEPLHTAAVLNVHGTSALLNLAGTMTRLKALVHVSTAYSNAPQNYIEERVYPPPYDPISIMSCTKSLPPDSVNVIAETLQGEHPNTYTLTKALAESIVYSHTELPVCIVRPSIVTAAVHEPFPGWIDNVYGVTGIIMEISRGTYRSGYCRQRYVVDLVPVDIVVNSCILAAWRQGRDSPGRCPVYNVTSGSINPLQWGQFASLCVKWAKENPTKYVMWYPSFSFTESRLINTFWEMTCHFLPAFLYDFMLRAQGRKAIMMKLARRFKMAAATGEYFANNEWKFEVTELKALHDLAINTKDGNIFNMWPDQYNWDDYIGKYMMGIRKFILKDTTESLPAARTKLNRLYWIHRLCQIVSGYYLFRFVAGRFR